MQRFFYCFVTVSLTLFFGCSGDKQKLDETSSYSKFEKPLKIQKPQKNIAQNRSGGCGPVPAVLRKKPYHLDEFYQQYCDANGIPVLASSAVRAEALRVIKRRAEAMMQKLPARVRQEMLNTHTRIAIIGQGEVTTDMPEYSDLSKEYPETDWDKRTRGLGAMLSRPVSSSAEENALCLSNDVYAGSDIFVHEFAHTIHIMGLSRSDIRFNTELNNAYHAAIKKGLWTDTYAGTDSREYWAEGVQSWFNLNNENRKGVHNHVNTRAELKHYDSSLHDLIAKYMPSLSLLICSN